MSWKPFRDATTRARWRQALMERQGGLCALYGHRFPEATETNESIRTAFAPTFDHVVPRSRGGPDELGNLRITHFS